MVSRYESKAYRSFITGKKCMICGDPDSDPHHWFTKGRYANDLCCLPLCRKHHNEFHSSGVETFMKKHRIDYRFIYRKTIEYLTEYIIGSE